MGDLVPKRSNGFVNRGKNVERRNKSREMAKEALRLRYEGNLTWREIAELVGYAHPAAAKRAAERIEAEDTGDSITRLKRIQHKRLEKMFQGLGKKIDMGSERAIEVGVKVLERQARLHGLDEVDYAATQGPNRTQILIQISPHPGDTDAVKLVESRESKLLSPPIEGVVLREEDNSSDRGNGSG